MAGGWRRLHTKELYNLYSSPNISVIKEGEACSTRGKDEKCVPKLGRRSCREQTTRKT